MIDENGPPPALPPPEPPAKENGSGEGADTAMRALIRKRRQVEGPDEAAPANGDPEA